MLTQFLDALLEIPPIKSVVRQVGGITVRNETLFRPFVRLLPIRELG